MSPNFRFQPGWSTPITVDYRKPSFIAWLLGIANERDYCRARRQGRCPGLEHCPDCTWSQQPSR